MWQYNCCLWNVIPLPNITELSASYQSSCAQECSPSLPDALERIGFVFVDEMRGRLGCFVCLQFSAASSDTSISYSSKIIPYLCIISDIMAKCH
jgi:hypothetical protein